MYQQQTCSPQSGLQILTLLQQSQTTHKAGQGAQSGDEPTSSGKPPEEKLLARKNPTYMLEKSL